MHSRSPFLKMWRNGERVSASHVSLLFTLEKLRIGYDLCEKNVPLRNFMNDDEQSSSSSSTTSSNSGSSPQSIQQKELNAKLTGLKQANRAAYNHLKAMKHRL